MTSFQACSGSLSCSDASVVRRPAPSRARRSASSWIAAITPTWYESSMPLAAVWHAFGEAPAVEEVTLDGPRTGEVLVRIRAVAICHSDLAYAAGAWGGALPAVYGHEAAGEVLAVGDGVGHVRAGDHVVVHLVRACGGCERCLAGEPT